MKNNSVIGKLKLRVTYSFEGLRVSKSSVNILYIYIYMINRCSY